MNNCKLLEVLDIFFCFEGNIEFVFKFFDLFFSDLKNFLNNLEKKKFVMINMEKAKLKI